MARSHDSGKEGELEVVNLVKCPNCGKSLMTLPPNYPLFDLQCSGCEFRAQVKTSSSRPTDQIRGAGWDVMEKVTKSGYMVPPLIANHKWVEGGVKKQTILFFPFVPRTNLKMHTLSPTARRANYRMFNYVGMRELPHFVLFPESK